MSHHVATSRHSPPARTETMSPQLTRHRCLLLGISGPSSSGKTTLARLLRDIFPTAFVLHEDDFYKTDAEIPLNTSAGNVQDWDCLESLDVPAFENALKYIRTHGVPPPNLLSKEDQNSVGPVDIDDGVVASLKRHASQWTAQDVAPIAVVDGFLLYSESMKAVRDLFDVKLFLRADYATAKKRRAARSGYVTLKGFWEDPPEYVNRVVWPNFIKEHAFLFEDGDVEGNFKEELLAELRIRTMPWSGQHSMTKCLEWACGILDDALGSRISARGSGESVSYLKSSGARAEPNDPQQSSAALQ